MVSVIFILPETKGISLERMDRIFGQVDAVEAGERERSASLAEADAIHMAVAGRKSNERDLEKELEKDVDHVRQVEVIDERK